MSLRAPIVSAPSLLRVLCLRCAKYAATDDSVECKFDKQSSNKCARCREQKSSCVPVPAALVARGNKLLRLLRLLREHPGSEERQFNLRAAIKRVSNKIKAQAEALLRADAPPKGVEALSRALLTEQKKTNALLEEAISLLRLQVGAPAPAPADSDEDDDDDDENDEFPSSEEEDEDEDEGMW